MERCAERRKLLLVELKTVNKDLRMNGVSDEDSLPRRRRAYVSERVSGARCGVDLMEAVWGVGALRGAEDELKTVNKDSIMNGVSDEDPLPRRRRAYVSERVGGRASKRASDRRPLPSTAVARAVASETAKGGRPCRETKKLPLGDKGGEAVKAPLRFLLPPGLVTRKVKHCHA